VAPPFYAFAKSVKNLSVFQGACQQLHACVGDMPGFPIEAFGNDKGRSPSPQGGFVKKTKVCEIFLDKNKNSGIIPLLVLNYYNI